MLRNTCAFRKAFADFRVSGSDGVDKPSSMMRDCRRVSLQTALFFASGFDRKLQVTYIGIDKIKMTMNPGTHEEM